MHSKFIEYDACYMSFQFSTHQLNRLINIKNPYESVYFLVIDP